MSRHRHWRRTLSSALGLAALSTLACQPEARVPTGVVLISIDTLRADHLGCYGYPRRTSPFIDSLAERGVLFERATAQVHGTLPSHMSMLTGLLPVEHSVFPPDDVLSEDILLLQQILQSRGIRTAGFTEGGYVSGRFGFERGFEEFDDEVRKLNTDVEDSFQRGIDFLSGLDSSQSFFLFLHTYTVHDPYAPPISYARRYLESADQVQLEDGKFPDTGLQPGTTPPLEEKLAQHRDSVNFIKRNLPAGVPFPDGPTLSEINSSRTRLPETAAPFYRALYDGTINYVDDVLRAFFARLRDLGLEDSTMVIITSDHGEEFLEHGRFAHEQIYNECIQVPLIVIGSDVVPGRRVRDLIMIVDIAPTILDLFGVQPPGNTTGRTLRPLLTEDAGWISPRDAHAIGVVDPSETIYRRVGESTLQLVIHHLGDRGLGPWVGREISLYPPASTIHFEAMSYHEARNVEVRIDEHPTTILKLDAEWQSYTLDITEDGRQHEVKMIVDSCTSPSALGESDDVRCLGFRLRGFPSRESELFDLGQDPSGSVNLEVDQPALVSALESGLSEFHKAPLADSMDVPLSPETEERLRALGYLK